MKLRDFDARVAGALSEAGDAAVWIAAARRVGAADRPKVPYDGVGFVHVEVFSPSRRLINALKRLGVTRRREPGVWRVDGEWDRPPGQLVSERAPPCEAAVRVLNRALGDEGNFALYEVLD